MDIVSQTLLLLMPLQVTPQVTVDCSSIPSQPEVVLGTEGSTGQDAAAIRMELSALQKLSSAVRICVWGVFFPPKFSWNQEQDRAASRLGDGDSRGPPAPPPGNPEYRVGLRLTKVGEKKKKANSYNSRNYKRNHLKARWFLSRNLSRKSAV